MLLCSFFISTACRSEFHLSFFLEYSTLFATWESYNWLFFLRFCYMDVITPGFLGLSQNVQYRMKKSLCPCAKKVPETFSPRPITPRYHSFAAWVSNTSLIKVKTATPGYSGYCPKIKYTIGSNLQHSAVLKNIIIEFLPFFPLL